MADVGVPGRVLRRAARVLAVSERGRLLLLRGGDPARPGTHIWHAPGGGVEAGETDRAAAAREFVEETGRAVELGPLVWDRELDFSFNHVLYHQYEVFFLAHVGAEFEPERTGHNDIELEYLSGHGWFTPDELRAAGERDLLAPPDAVERLAEILRDGPPERPVRVLGAVLP
ncbi:MAG: NUDIX domain-containing protein [Actinomycetales bacterium]|nr:NUDIX domain-containing protein [Actinomycetales bacterium]